MSGGAERILRAGVRLGGSGREEWGGGHPLQELGLRNRVRQAGHGGGGTVQRRIQKDRSAHCRCQVSETCITGNAREGLCPQFYRPGNHEGRAASAQWP